MLDLAVLPLPAPVHDKLDSVLRGFLTESGPRFDFSSPSGEQALVGPDSVSWRIFKNQVALFIGGVAAVLLELGEPNVRDGVWHHTSFRTEPLKRLQRTGLAAMVTVYGAHSRAEAMIAGVVRAHDRITGVTSEGEPYHANDPALLDWVQATAGFGFMEAYHRYVRPLSQAEREALFREAAPAARLYGAVGAPASEADWARMLEGMRDRLTPSPIVSEFLDIMQRVDALPRIANPMQVALVKAAVAILPPWVRTRLGIGEEYHLSRRERIAVGLAAKAADRLLLKSSPPVQACRRLGLPDDYLYRPAH
ncbi:oxygenase MpaB family protein [Pseudorhizobium flavum]|uniref:oxygenase MpaB family protein n=1 Tax=Pseudorhizobium flavum TaxID=1335061 RepID=UPI00376F93C0